MSFQNKKLEEYEKGKKIKPNKAKHLRKRETLCGSGGREKKKKDKTLEDDGVF